MGDKPVGIDDETGGFIGRALAWLNATYATKAQGVLAATALQPEDLPGTDVFPVGDDGEVIKVVDGAWSPAPLTIENVVILQDVLDNKADLDAGKVPQTQLPAHLDPAQLSGTYVRFVDTEGNPLVGKLVTITVDTDNDEIADIIVEEL